jgi:dynamin 1-like protein
LIYEFISAAEAIVGRDFLPRGTGIVTRRPLVLQLITVTSMDMVPSQLRSAWGSGSAPALNLSPRAAPEEENPMVNAPEWAEFLHQKSRIYTNFDEVREEIQAETDRLLGKGKAISAEPIRLRIFSPHVLTLTLIDLPGITKVPVGDQPVDIESQLYEMIMSFISNPHCIILAVSAANQDLANSDALKLAREVDPYGLRTLGVLTKVDLMDNGTDALEILQGKVYPLKLGFVAVVNRSQQDIIEKRTISDALKNEAAFFQRHPAYRVLAHRLGTPFLSRSLNQILMNHIKDCLPDIKNRIAHQIMELEQELNVLGNPLNSASSNPGALVLQLVSKFCSNFCDAIDGRLQEVYGGMAELYGGARISYTFHELFAAALDQIDPFDRLSDQDIRTAIRNATGPRPSLFVPEISFDLLVKRQILRLEEPAQQCCELVFDELLQVAAQCDPPELTRFTHLREKVIEVVSTLLRSRLAPTKQTISSHIQIELAYINTNHPDFIGGARAVTQLAEQGRNAAAATTNNTQASKDPTQAMNMAMQQAAAAAAANVGKKAAVHQGRDISEVDSNGFMQTLMARFQGANPRSTGMAPPPVMMPRDERDDDTSIEGDYHQYKPSVREKVETSIIKTLISSYFNIVRKTVQDVVPKAIMCLLVNATKTELQSELVRALYKEDLFPLLLRERDDVAERRQTSEAMLATLKRAMAITNEIRDFSPAPGGVTAANTSASAAAQAAFAIASPSRDRRLAGGHA